MHLTVFLVTQALRHLHVTPQQTGFLHTGPKT